MGTAKTFMLLAALTALFMAVGYLIGGVLGMAIAFVAAAGMNVFSWWNADKIVLRMQGAKEVTPETSSPMLRTFAGDVARMAEPQQLRVRSACWQISRCSLAASGRASSALSQS